MRQQGPLSDSASSMSRSRYNRMTWGVMIHDILPCQGTKCVYRPTCRYIRTRPHRLQCTRGSRCPAEIASYQSIVDNMNQSYGEARAVLGDAAFGQAAHDFAILLLRKERLSARIAAEGLIEVRTMSDGSLEMRQALAFRRYQTALDREFNRVLCALRMLPTPSPS